MASLDGLKTRFLDAVDVTEATLEASHGLVDWLFGGRVVAHTNRVNLPGTLAGAVEINGALFWVWHRREVYPLSTSGNPPSISAQASLPDYHILYPRVLYTGADNSSVTVPLEQGEETFQT